jgi:hypothetical protein
MRSLVPRQPGQGPVYAARLALQRDFRVAHRVARPGVSARRQAHGSTQVHTVATAHHWLGHGPLNLCVQLLDWPVGRKEGHSEAPARQIHHWPAAFGGQRQRAIGFPASITESRR